MNGGDFKRAEYIGDAVLELVVRECRAKPIDSTGNIITSNKHLVEVARDLGIEPHAEDRMINGMNYNKCYANAVEAKIGLIYMNDGLEAAREWILENVVKGYKERFKRITVSRGVVVEKPKLSQSAIQEYWASWGGDGKKV